MNKILKNTLKSFKEHDKYSIIYGFKYNCHYKKKINYAVTLKVNVFINNRQVFQECGNRYE